MKRNVYAESDEPNHIEERNKSYFSVGNKRHLPSLGRYDLADAILFGFGTDGAEVPHWIHEFLSGGIESGCIINSKRALFLRGLESARYARSDGVHIEFLCNVDGQNAEIGVATGVLVLFGRASMLQRHICRRLLLFMSNGRIGSNGPGGARSRSEFGRTLNPRWLLCSPPRHARRIGWSNGHDDSIARVFIPIIIFDLACTDHGNG